MRHESVNNYDDDFVWSKYFSTPKKNSYKNDVFAPRRIQHSWTFSNPSSYSYESASNDIYSNEISSRNLPVSFDEPGGDYFSYDDNDEAGPAKWWKINKNCSGNYQSPVILYDSISFSQEPSEPLAIEGFKAIPSSVVATNTGHSISVRLDFGESSLAKVSGGPLRSPYIIDNIHWHWGENNFHGSEHALNGKQYAAEAHFVCWNAKFCESKLLAL